LKIVFDFQDAIGGAPRSLLAHAKAARNAGHVVIGTIGRDEDASFISDAGIDVRVIPNFVMGRPLYNMQLLLRWRSFLTHEKPQLLHANRPVQCKFLAVVSILTGVKFLPAQAGGVARQADIIPLQGFPVLVYSSENMEQYSKCGFDKSDIHVIRNRIAEPEEQTEHEGINDAELQILCIGNFKEGTVGGIKSLLLAIGRNSINVSRRFKLLLAGADITPDRHLTKDIEQLVARTNQSLGRRGKVTWLNWVDDLSSLYIRANVVVGKGRSVLQPAMMGKIAFVLSERGFVTRIKRSEYDVLSAYNFSGRGALCDDTKDFLAMLQSVDDETHAHYLFDREARSIAGEIRNDYSVSFLRLSLERVYDTVSRQTQPATSLKRYAQACCRLLIIYRSAAEAYLRRRCRVISGG